MITITAVITAMSFFFTQQCPDDSIQEFFSLHCPDGYGSRQWWWLLPPPSVPLAVITSSTLAMTVRAMDTAITTSNDDGDEGHGQ